jgi:hypothetical protein
MTKLNWSRAKRSMWRDNAPLADAAGKWLDQHAERQRTSPTPPRAHSRDITIVIGADAPSNTTGQRQVHEFQTLSQAHKAGFTWAI